MATKIYVVSGSYGEYSNRSEWMVCAYASEEDAKQHVVKATEYAKAWAALARTEKVMNLDYREHEEMMKKSNPMDPYFSSDYYETEYTYGEVDLLDKFASPEVVN